MHLVSSVPAAAQPPAEGGDSRPRYRADIDGLRAIAIISVVLFHAHVPLFGGGFVGVDVFFVISGFLIGGIVFRDVRRGRFTFATFYTRRARRIVPALLGVSLVMSAVALALLPPEPLREFAKSNASALLGAANVRFWVLTHFQGADWQLDPLVMAWSLGVEEQFYLFLPPLMLALHRFAPKAVAATIIGVSLLSLALSVHWSSSQPSAAFYLLPGRAWELGVGVLAALWQDRARRRIGRRFAQWLSVIALAAILAAVVLFDEQTRFPGFAATLPILGTAALIVAEPSTINRLLLASLPMRFVGLISYSWYLWHWPLIAFARVSLGHEPSPVIFAVIVLLSFLAAVLSWRFIETRFRQPTARLNAKVLLRYGAAILGCLGVAGLCYAAASFGEESAPQTVSRAHRGAV